mgnify:CR=1 FL=1
MPANDIPVENVQNVAETERNLNPILDAIADEVKDLEAPENPVEIKSEASPSRAIKIIGSGVFALIYSFILFWVIILFKGGFSSLNDD